MTSAGSDPDPSAGGREEPDTVAKPVASALRALATCVEFLLSGGRRDLRRERQKLNEAQRLIADIEGRVEGMRGTAAGPASPRSVNPP